MLREGWDVRNVVVIVPLRPYTAKAQILPEQTLGRGLRRMSLPASGIDEQVIVIEHEAFKPFWKNELEEEGLEVEWVPADNVRPNFRPVYVDRSKLEYDIEVPILSPALVTSTAGLESFGLNNIKPRRVSPPQPGLDSGAKPLGVSETSPRKRDFLRTFMKPANPWKYLNN